MRSDNANMSNYKILRKDPPKVQGFSDL